MRGNNKALKYTLVCYVIIILGIISFNLLEPLLYGFNTKGNKTANEFIYDVAHAIISKKYEALLYEDSENLYNIFSYNCTYKLENLNNSSIIEKIINNFVSFQITSIEQKNYNKYIIYYNEKFDDSTVAENKMIIKYKNDKAIIYYDSILEARYE